MKNETNTTAVRNSNTPGTIAFILALVSVAIWAFVGVEFFIIRDQMMNSVVLLASVIGWIPLTASFVLAIIGLCRKDDGGWRCFPLPGRKGDDLFSA